jgi:dipeptidyl-peptidase-4
MALVVATYRNHVPICSNTWGAEREQPFTILVCQQFTVLKLNNRGSNLKWPFGLASLTFTAKSGDLGVTDQVKRYPNEHCQGIADLEKVAVSDLEIALIGYMALKCLSGTSDVFHAAVAGAPVTDWTLYVLPAAGTLWALPEENP